MTQAKDVMNQNVITVPPRTTVIEAIRILLEHNVSGAPVVDEQGVMCGIISEFQLLQVIYDPQIRSEPIGNLMTKNVLSVEEDASLEHIASLFVIHRIRRIPVLRDGKLSGVISRSDLLRHAAEGGTAIENIATTAKLFAVQG